MSSLKEIINEDYRNVKENMDLGILDESVVNGAPNIELFVVTTNKSMPGLKEYFKAKGESINKNYICKNILKSYESWILDIILADFLSRSIILQTSPVDLHSCLKPLIGYGLYLI